MSKRKEVLTSPLLKKGHVHKEPIKPDVEVCQKCNGTGVLRLWDVPCNKCGGEGSRPIR